MKKIILIALIALAPVRLGAQTWYEDIISQKWFLPTAGFFLIGSVSYARLVQQKNVLAAKNKAYMQENELLGKERKGFSEALERFIPESKGSFYDAKKDVVMSKYCLDPDEPISLNALVARRLNNIDLQYKFFSAFKAAFDIQSMRYTDHGKEIGDWRVDTLVEKDKELKNYLIIKN